MFSVGSDTYLQLNFTEQNPTNDKYRKISDRPAESDIKKIVESSEPTPIPRK